MIRDHVVDVENRYQQAFDEVQAVLSFTAGEIGAASGDVVPVPEVNRQQVAEGQGTRLAVNQSDGIDGVVVLDLGQA
jgi:hypothetical protein